MMKCSLEKTKLVITPEDKSGCGGIYPADYRDSAYIENVLGLKKDGDSIRLVRRQHNISYYTIETEASDAE